MPSLQWYRIPWHSCLVHVGQDWNFFAPQRGMVVNACCRQIDHDHAHLGFPPEITGIFQAGCADSGG